ncbi:MAG: DUF84 family protein [Polyangiales bacterium]
MIIIASENPTKIEAARAALAQYPRLAKEQLVSMAVPSQVRRQPMSLTETIEGATNRAYGALRASPLCDLAIGIESGVFLLPNDRIKQLVGTCACAIAGRGKYPLVEMSSTWTLPWRVAELVLNGKSVSEAALETGYTHQQDVGHYDGLIGVLSGGRLTRKTYMQEAVRNALMNMSPAERD